MYLPETNIRVLELLNIYSYLSTSQFMKLGLAKYQQSISKILNRFFESKKPMIKKLTFPIDPKRGKLENIYLLSKEGAKFLADLNQVNLDEISYPKGTGSFYRDYNHRKRTIDYHIKLRLEAEEKNYEVEFFHTYFDKKGSQYSKNKDDRLQSKTKVELSDGSFFIPDAIYKTIQTKKDGSTQDYLYALEIHNGSDTKRAVETIEKHLKALEDGGLSEKYDYPYSHKVVVVFENKIYSDNLLVKLYYGSKINMLLKYFEFTKY